jgi:hypothetical protein
MVEDNTWKELRTLESYPEKLKGVLGEKYSVLDPRELYLGRSYSDYVVDWFNWFLSFKADNRNSGPVVFLRSKHIPDTKTQTYDLEVSGKTTITTGSSQDLFYPTSYVNEPNIRIGIDRLEIFEDQAVFVPIITAYSYSDRPYMDWGYMQEFVGIIIDNGDNPPDLIQLTINNDTLVLPEGLPGKDKDFRDFRIATPVFTAVVPEAPYGTSIKDFLEGGPVPPGSYPAMVTGYFVMLKFKPGSYWVHSWASAGREVRGPYFSELLYQIDVSTRPIAVPHHRITVKRPSHFQAMTDRAVENMIKNKELTEEDSEFIKQIQQKLNQRFRDQQQSQDELRKEMQDKLSRPP